MTVSRFLFERRVPLDLRRVQAAIVAPPLAMALYGLMMPLWFGNGSTEQAIGMAVMVVGIGSLFAYVGMLVVGVPANLALKSLKAERGIAYVLIGALSVPIALTFNDATAPRFEQLTLAAAPGALVAALWWLIASRK
jgi:hypothetical protein